MLLYLESKTMHRSVLFLILGLGAASGTSSYTPKQYHVGSNVTIEGLSGYSGDSFTLDASSRVVTLDYGTEVAGFPYLEVKSLGAPVQIELKYSEPFEGLGLPQGDGPW